MVVQQGSEGTVTLERPRVRTSDVLSDNAKSFEDLLLSPALISSLKLSGFTQPSPVQQSAIPLGRIGSDLIVQAKSGTGKTVAFAVICLLRVKVAVTLPQALILAPSREIAIQSEQVVCKLAAGLAAPAITSAVFVGGLPVVDDEKRLRRLVHIAVGTPGRVCALVTSGALTLDSLSMFVLDEADALLSDSFYSDVTWLYDQLPRKKQVMAFSATYTPELLAELEPLMKRPQRVMMCEETVSLVGVKQFYRLVGEAQSAASTEQQQGVTESSSMVTSPPPVFERKVAALLELLGGVSFHQSAVFCNYKPHAEWLASRLTQAGYPAVYLSGDVPQEERMQGIANVKGFKARVVVSTDVLARGVDLERVNLVVNLDLPRNGATYMHRVGRTGRFGTLGVAVSYLTPTELDTLRSYLKSETTGGAEIHLSPLPDALPQELYHFESTNTWEAEALKKLEAAPVGEGVVVAAPPSAAIAAEQAAAKALEEKEERRAVRQAEKRAAAVLLQQEQQALLEQQTQQQQDVSQGAWGQQSQWETDYPGYYWDGYSYVANPTSSNELAEPTNFGSQQQAVQWQWPASTSSHIAAPSTIHTTQSTAPLGHHHHSQDDVAAAWAAYNYQQQLQQQQGNGQEYSAEWDAYYNQQQQLGAAADWAAYHGSQTQSSQPQQYAAEWEAYYTQQRLQQQLTTGQPSQQDYSAEWAAYYSQQQPNGSINGLTAASISTDASQQQGGPAELGGGTNLHPSNNTDTTLHEQATPTGGRGAPGVGSVSDDESGDDEIGLDVLVGRLAAKPQQGAATVRFDLSHSSEEDYDDGCLDADAEDGSEEDEEGSGAEEEGESEESDGGELDPHAASLIDNLMLLSVTDSAADNQQHQHSDSVLATGQGSSTPKASPTSVLTTEGLQTGGGHVLEGGGVSGSGGVQGVVTGSAGSIASAAASGVTATAVSHRVVVGAGRPAGQHPATMQLGVGASRSSLRSAQATPPSLMPHQPHVSHPASLHPEPTPFPYHTHTPAATATAAAAPTAAAWPYSSHPSGHSMTDVSHSQAYSMHMWSPAATAAANIPFLQASYHPSLYTHHHMPPAGASYPSPPAAPAPMSSSTGSTAAPGGFQANGGGGWAGSVAAGAVNTCAQCNTRCAGCVSAALRQFLTGYSSWHQSYTRWQQQYESWALLQGGPRMQEQQEYNAWVSQQQDYQAVTRRQQEYQAWPQQQQQQQQQQGHWGGVQPWGRQAGQQQQQPQQQQSYEDAWAAYRQRCGVE